MTLNELKRKYADLSYAIDALAADGARDETRLLRLIAELDDVHRELSQLRRLTFGAPTLRDAVLLAA